MASNRRKMVRTIEGAKKQIRTKLNAEHTVLVSSLIAEYGPKSQLLISDAILSLAGASEIEWAGTYGECIRFVRTQSKDGQKQEQRQEQRQEQAPSNRFRGLSEAEAKALYRKELFRLHPDRNAGESAAFLAMQAEYAAR